MNRFCILFLFLCLPMVMWAQKKSKEKEKPVETEEKAKPASFKFVGKEVSWGEISMSFPATFTEKKTQNSQGKSVFVSSQYNGTAYMLNYVVHTYPLGKVPTDVLLDAAVNTIVENCKGSLVSSDEWMFGEYKGKAGLIIDSEHDKMYDYRCVIVGQLQIQSMVAHKIGYSDETNITRFFGSLKWKE